ncbi:MAG: hypothetical protein HOP30_09445 [Cyclobacteriaceae bacterium]|nr:hypothetical protein [Cyclobacteriaceae bacterium]
MQNKWRFFYAFAALVLPLSAIGQDNTRGDRSPTPSAVEEKTHRVHLSRKEKRRQRLLFKKPKAENTARYEFYKRVEEAAKEKQKLLKKLSKPQYSNFAYFGHKKKPKRNKPYAMKYCKECGIRH